MSSNKAKKLLCRIVFIYLVIFGFFFYLIRTFNLISVLLFRNPNVRWSLLLK